MFARCRLLPSHCQASIWGCFRARGLARSCQTNANSSLQFHPLILQPAGTTSINPCPLLLLDPFTGPGCKNRGLTQWCRYPARCWLVSSLSGDSFCLFSLPCMFVFSAGGGHGELPLDHIVAFSLISSSFFYVDKDNEVKTPKMFYTVCDYYNRLYLNILSYSFS